MGNHGGLDYMLLRHTHLRQVLRSGLLLLGSRSRALVLLGS